MKIDFQEKPKFRKAFWYSYPMLFLLGTAFVFMNAWSAYIVGHGLAVSENFAYAPWWAVYVFAGVIQMGVATGFLYLPDMWKLASWPVKLVWIPFLWSIIVAAVTFEIGHQVLAQVKESQGASLMNVQSREMDGLRSRINNWTAQMPAIYKAKSAEYFAQMTLSKRGFDESGIPGEGSIYRGRLAKYNAARTNFIDLSFPSSPLTAAGDFRGDFAAIQAQVSAMQNQILRIGEFYSALDNTNVPANVTAELVAIGKEVAEKAGQLQAFNDVSPRSLAINETLSLPRKIIRGEPFPLHYWLGVAYGVAPFVIGLIFSSAIRHHNAWNSMGSHDTVASLKGQLEHEQTVEKLYSQLAEVREKSFSSNLRGRIYGAYREGSINAAANDELGRKRV